MYYVPYDPFTVEYENGDSVVMRSHGRIVQRHLVTSEEKEFVIDDKYDVGGLRMFCFRGRLFTSVIDYNKDSDRIAVVELDLLTGKYRSVPTQIFN